MTNATQEHQSFEQFRKMVGAFTVPKELLDLNQSDYQKKVFSEGVRRGQLWVACQGNYSLYVLVKQINFNKRTIVIVPMETDLDIRTKGSLVILGNTPLGMAMVAWPTLAIEIPVRLLSKPSGEFDQETLKCLSGDYPRTPNIHLVGQTYHDADEESYFEMVNQLKRWHGLCARLPKLATTETINDSARSISMTKDRAIAVRVLARKFGMKPNEAVRIVDRVVPLTAEQSQALEEIGIDLNDIPRRTNILPKELLIEVEQPRWREYADRLDENEGDPRLRLAQSAVELAARGNEHGTPSWRGRLNQVTDAKQLAIK